VVKILNLGLADLTEAAPVYSGVARQALRPGGAGAPDFLAPETALNSRAADIRSDIYSLGCILYFALAGKPPFPDGTVNDKIFSHQFKEPQPLEKLRQDVPAKLSVVIKRMMAKNPNQRQQTPVEVANDLTPFCVTNSSALKKS
jgi:eukaryotic-like serine/threonine-protein kinase